jgi:hypothetical protein
VRVLLDEQLPRRLALAIAGHEARTVRQQEWTGLENGDLLREAETAGFEAFITADRSLEFQQRLDRLRLFVIVLIAPSIALDDLLPLVPRILLELENARPGGIAHVSARLQS